jgi:hypothetical protein
MPIKTPCLTCRTTDADLPKGAKLPNRKCLIRQCVERAGVVNCAYCARFPCDTVTATGAAWTREAIEAKLGTPIADEAYRTFVAPFEGIRRLKAIRATLKPGAIKEPARIAPAEPRTADFPAQLPFSKEETAAFRAVHTLLATVNRSSLGLRDTDTFAQQHRLESRRAHVLRFLWILGRHGRVEEEGRPHLAVDAEAFEANRGSEKTLAIWSFVKATVFPVLSELGIHGARVALPGVKEETLVTGTGYLRSKGWIMTMAFDETIGGTALLKALQTYTRALDAKYGTKAFRHFAAVNMQILREK